MGLIDFIRSAGEKIFGTNEAAAAPTTDETVLSKRATALEDHVKGLGLPVEGLKIKVTSDVAFVKGTTDTQETREKILLAVGNVAGIARVEDRIDVTNPEPEARYYTVEKGDTLSKISKKEYGDPNRYAIIFEANKPMLTHPDKIYPGQVLRIPEPTAEA
jgi:nucleoid-associated protein YgaU